MVTLAAVLLKYKLLYLFQPLVPGRQNTCQIVTQFATEKDYDVKYNLSFPGKILKKYNLPSWNFQLALQTVKKWL